MMYAVVRTGGKQARVAPGESIRVEKLEGSVGDNVELAEVLLIGGEGEARVGTPLLAGAKVVGTITAQGRHPKITIFKMKRRKGYRRKNGHRQAYTEVRVDRIEG
jgi:large subunit ribosomal protein L21